MKKVFLILLLLTAWVNAQEKSKQSYSLSLDQAIGHAMEHNYAAINATRDIEIAKQKKRKRPLWVCRRLTVR